MSQHLTSKEIENYRKHKLSSEDLLLIDDHTAICQSCRDKLCDEENATASFRSLQMSFTTPNEVEAVHLSYRQLAEYVDGKLDKVNHEIVLNHLETCPQCTAEAGELEELKMSLLAQPVQSFSPNLSWWQRLTSTVSWYSILWRFGAALIGLLIMWIVMQTPQKELTTTNFSPLKNSAGKMGEKQLEPPSVDPSNVSPTSDIILSLQDGKKHLAIDREGNITGSLELSNSYQEAIKKALLEQRIETAPIVTDLITRKDRFMGEMHSDPSFTLISPVGTVVQSDRPTFSWQSVAGADNYTVSVYDLEFNEVAMGQALAGTQWTLKQMLKRGQIYYWQVTAHQKDKELIALPAKFMVLEKASIVKLEKIKQSEANSSLLLAVVYAQMGLLDDAKVELETLLKANNGLPVIKKLLQSLEKSRYQ
ncbi:MAG: zf-HC2 domain-containing protein [Acidobacteriota bacterium]